MKTDELKALYSQYKLVIYPVIVGLVALVLIYFVIFPQITKYFKTKEDEATLRDKIVRLDTKAQDLEGLDNATINSDLNIALKAVPTDRDLAGLVGVIRDLSTKNGVILVSLNVAQGSSSLQKNFNPFDIRLELAGNKDSINAFLNNLQSASRVIKISTIDLTLASASDSASALTTANVFYAPAPQEIGALDSPVEKLSDQDQKVLDALNKSNGGQIPTEVAPIVPKGKPNPFE